jgi:hypothetical protein
MQAAMIFAYGDEEYDDHGRLTAQFRGKHLIVGYYPSRQVRQWLRFEIGGHAISISRDTLFCLRGKTLALKKKRGRSCICPHVLVAA